MVHYDRTLHAELPTPEDTDRLGAAFGVALARRADAIRAVGLAVRLEGDLGAGKTSLVRALLRALGWTGAVKSPTFSLLETYEVATGFTVNHFDFYRFETPEEFDDAGFEECFGPGSVVFSEWSIKAEPRLPAADLVVRLAESGYGRAVRLEAASTEGTALLNALAEEFSPWN